MPTRREMQHARERDQKNKREAMCEAHGIQWTPEVDAQLEVFINALGTFADRDKTYGPVWKQYGALSNLLSVARKADRLMALWWHSGSPPALHKDPLDDAIDLLNYTAFFMRNARVLNLLGSQPERPNG